MVLDIHQMLEQLSFAILASEYTLHALVMNR